MYWLLFFGFFCYLPVRKSQKVQLRRLLHLPRVTVHYFNPKKWIVSLCDEECPEYCYYYTLYLYFTNYNSSLVLIPIFFMVFFIFNILYIHIYYIKLDHFTCVKKKCDVCLIHVYASSYFYRFIFNWKLFISKINNDVLMLCKKKFSLMGDMLDFFQKLFFPARCSKYLFSLAIEEHQFKIYVLL